MLIFFSTFCSHVALPGQVTFRSEDGKPLAIFEVKVEPTPSIVDQSIRFYHPESCFLKKSLRLSPWEDLAGVDH